MIDGNGHGKPHFVDMADALGPEPSSSAKTVEPSHSATSAMH